RCRRSTANLRSIPKELDRFGLRFYNPSPCSPLRGWQWRGKRQPVPHSVRSICVTGERTHMATTKSNSGKKTWTLLAAGTAVIVLTAGVLLQVTRPPSAFPEETNAAGGRAAQPGKGSAAEAGQMALAKVARVGKEYITWQELANEC